MTEKQIENSILQYLRLVGVFAWKCQSTGIYDATKKVFRKSNNIYHINGVADILGILSDGRLLAIEVKRPKAYPSKSQKEFLSNIISKGGVAFIARSIDDVKQILDGLSEQN